RHLLLGEPDLLPSELGEREVLHLEGRPLLRRRAGLPLCALAHRVLPFVFLSSRRRAVAANSAGPCACGAAGSGSTRASSKPTSASHPAICSRPNPIHTCPIAWRYSCRSCS